MKIMLCFAFMVFSSCNLSFATVMDPTGYASVTSVGFLTSASVSQEINVPLSKMVSLVINKQGAGQGTVKLQGSNDGTTWKDINSTTYPDSTSAIGTGTTSAVISVIAFPYLKARFLFTESGTGAGSIVGGKWITK